MKLMARTGYAILGAVVFDDRIVHGYSLNDVPNTLAATLATSRLKN